MLRLLKNVATGAVLVLGAVGIACVVAKKIENSSDSELIDGAKELGKGIIDVVGEMSNSDEVKTFGKFTNYTLDVAAEVAKQ